MVHRFWVRRKQGFRNAEEALSASLTSVLSLTNAARTAIYHRYDIEGMNDEEAAYVSRSILSMVQRDELFSEMPPCSWALGVEMLGGQFDQRSDSTAMCIQLVYPHLNCSVRCATFYCFDSELTDEEKLRIKAYLINPVEACEASMHMPEHIGQSCSAPSFPACLDGFCSRSDRSNVLEEYSLAMDSDDLALVQQYFADKGRDPFLTELKVIDTYWSDHCRHTTFLTELDKVVIDDPQVLCVFASYLEARRSLACNKPICLMDLATIAAKQLKKQGKLDHLEVSEEINACSVKVDVQTDAGLLPCLLLFKNETHNHPTEIEPFGGAATCIGGAIRDPLSSRAYVYQAMRISGTADPRTPLCETLEGKLPQRVIAQRSALGYSSYGNQIGLATGMVEEIHHPNFVAKHLELGFVIGAARQQYVRRERPEEGDLVILVGGRTGRDGCGGATGSSKSHDGTSLGACAAEVQKGNAPEQRKIQRLLRRAEVSSLIKRCNDFGAGGVSVAIGELAPGLVVDLDAIPTKYEGLDGTERAISESQERMAMVVGPADVPAFLQYAHEENLEATVVARVTSLPMLRMTYQGRTLVEIDRSLLDSNGAKKHATVHIPHLAKPKAGTSVQNAQAFEALLSDLNVAGKQALSQMFDSTIGAGTLLLPFGGKRMRTPIQAMAALIALPDVESATASLASWGYDPYLMQANPFEGAFSAVVHSLAKVVATGGDWDQTYLTFQEYFGRPGDDPQRWGVVASALLGAYKAQTLFGKAAIGGKDSMSGSFMHLDVPPTLVSFAVSVAFQDDVLSPEWKKAGSKLYLLQAERQRELPALFEQVSRLVKSKQVLSCWALGYGGIAEALAKMALGNNIGCTVTAELDLLCKRYGAFLVECDQELPLEGTFIGYTTQKDELCLPFVRMELEQVHRLLSAPLASVYGDLEQRDAAQTFPTLSYTKRARTRSRYPVKKPTVLMPVFFGTNCEYDVERAWKACNIDCNTVVINTQSEQDVRRSIIRLRDALRQSQILFLSGGFSAADEPDGSGKFIAAFLRNPLIQEEIANLLEQRDGLVGGICNGFQALVQLGLLPHGRITTINEHDPLLDYNRKGRHISTVVRTRVSSTLSPWFSEYEVGQIHLLPISHGEGRFTADADTLKALADGGLIASQYVDEQGYAAPFSIDNPNGSLYAVEALSSADGKVFGRMAHSERAIKKLYRNVPVEADCGLFMGAANYVR